jgi:hypothetical protein
MTDDLRQELVLEAERLPVPRGDLEDVLGGGRSALRRRRAFMAVSAVAVVGLASAGVAAVSTTPPDAGRPMIAPAASDDGRTTYTDPEERYSVTYPSDWDRATESLTPHVEDPEEILSVASFELRAGGEGCTFGHALEDLGPADAFVSVSESAGDLTSRYMITRPTQFAYDQGYQPTFSECLDTDPVFEDRFIPFRDGDRFFYAYVAVGEAASDETRAEALETLNSLAFGD